MPLPTELPLAAPRLEDAAAVSSLVSACGGMGNDLSFANMYLLQGKYNTQIALQGGFLYRRYSGNTRLNGYAYPLGTGDAAPALARLEQHAAATGTPLQFCLLTQEQSADLQQRYPGRFRETVNRGDADYLYLRTDLAELPGTAYHKKRNHLARFTRLHPDWEFRPLAAATVPHALLVAEQWLAGSEKTPALVHEYRAICHALQYRQLLGLTGGVAYAGGCPVAMAVASVVSPAAADIHYEKCAPEWRDAYPLINREMARMLPCTYINREEDLDIPGLRKAKESYHPALLLHKFSLLPC